ncbi:MAG: hypothetical protein D6701_00595 [Gemmatimonadetes bacterium]|nr:MAG: hypothetical protein D6701_00595 [Gemmatimonadota bacterium]
MKLATPYPAAAGALLCAVLAAGCVSTRSAMPGSTEDRARAVTVRIDNRHTSASSLTIYLVPEGSRDHIRLGTVRLAELREFKFGRQLRTTRWQLLARETGGQEFRSDLFVLQPGDRVEWRIGRRSVWVNPGDAGG